MEEVKGRILKLLKEKNMTKADLLKMSNLKKSTLYNVFDEKTDIGNVNLETLKSIANALNVSLDLLVSGKEEFSNYVSITKIKIPVLGSIACGQPIFADENLECYVDAINNINADFALWAQGDSMIDARINDGDLVFIKQQEIVENGEIAAVLVDDEATLKKVFYEPNKNRLMLISANKNYQPFIYEGEDLNKIKILGKAVAFQSNL